MLGQALNHLEPERSLGGMEGVRGSPETYEELHGQTLGRSCVFDLCQRNTEDHLTNPVEALHQRRLVAANHPLVETYLLVK